MIYTIGYERRSLRELLDLLVGNGVAVLVDVREVAWSRRREFSRGVLGPALEAARLEYIHAPDLGTPVEVRREVRESRDYDRFFAFWRERIKEKARYLEALASRAGGRTACFLCYERDPRRCHRLVVAEGFAQITRKEIAHL